MNHKLCKLKLLMQTLIVCGSLWNPNIFLNISKPGHHLRTIKDAVIASLPFHTWKKISTEIMLKN